MLRPFRKKEDPRCGGWLRVNGGAIYNSTGYPFGIAHGCTKPATPGTVRQCYTKGAGGDIFVITAAMPATLEFPPGALQPPPPPSAISLVGATAGI